MKRGILDSNLRKPIKMEFNVEFFEICPMRINEKKVAKPKKKK